MQKLTQAEFTAALTKVGVAAGDGLLVHSAVQFLGVPAGGPDLYLAGLRAVLGPQGTLAVPAFNFGFARGEPFDPINTPSNGMGVFSEFVRVQPGALRTKHPMQSLAVLGHYAADICSRDTPSAFDPGSSFERLLDLDFKVLLLGASVQAVSLVHYSEQRARVPYRYWKTFQGKVRRGDEWQEAEYKMYVRDLDLDPRLTLKPIQSALEASDQWRSAGLNYGQVAVCRAQDFVRATDTLLAKDPWGLVKKAQ
ncbi:MAG: AAC(3) family N-acetyltransferase [Anaerolineales bacterium]|nr:AAC(3) family N-acetyltransferase [Anaerolineales bacterium]